MDQNTMTLRELKSKLTAQQLQAAELLVANDYAGKDRRTLEAVAEELGISVRTLYEWRQNPDFNRYCAYNSESKLQAFSSVAEAQLMKLVMGTSNNGIPSIRGLELYFKRTGKLNNQSTIKIEDSRTAQSNRSTEDIMRDIESLDSLLDD